MDKELRTKSFATRQELRTFLEECAQTRSTLVAGHSIALPSAGEKPDYLMNINPLNAVLEHSVPDQVISVECGMSVGTLHDRLANSRQWFPIPEAYRELSLMAVIDCGLSGALETRFGGLRELVLGLDVMQASGTVIKCGGKVVKNVSGYDLTKLFVGAYGSLGVCLASHLRLFALPESSRTNCFRFDTLPEALSAATKILRSGLPISCLDITEGLLFQGKDDGSIYVCVQIHGTEALLTELSNALGDIMSGIISIELLPTDETELWQKLNETPFAAYHLFVLQASGRLLRDFMTSSAMPNVRWTVRPAANKLILRLDDSTAVPALVQAIKELSRSSFTPAQVGSGDKNFCWRVWRFPEEDSVREQLALKLKHQFDPCGIFNPLVTTL